MLYRPLDFGETPTVCRRHLHQLLDMPLEVRALGLCKMDTRIAGRGDESKDDEGMGRRVPTWRIVPGSSTESLALDVALNCAVPPAIVRRAGELYQVGLLYSYSNLVISNLCQ